MTIERPVGVAGLEVLNSLPARAARAELLTCCASRRWADEVAAGRPYPGLPALRSASAVALAARDWAGIREALAAHPRLGERPQGERPQGERPQGERPQGERSEDDGREAAWSRGEQSGADGAAAEVRAALAAGNRAYEGRFGHVFLLCATGLSAAEMLAALRARLGNDTGTEQSVVRYELTRIVDLRLAKLLDVIGEANGRTA
ncbi:2-oxo-4-hydroxy-4-carboxy-5-ureidoimidazoline decarboxylase [Actinomadura litoris]|uniref:2-oxo-4-hydroxy-4-carboxy-5-ureidoimidazoline decarboxylase n=1 Tax=Actinomadura litoris TaxID=2678616 RepID=UPI001FA81511|nr:2-oxo-4-hydroxy-4-carboxy-5-ureidoimidazoline decarboxylase [Actinomadura litoris]